MPTKALADLTPDELLRRLRRLQHKMQDLWDKQEVWQRDYPTQAGEARRKFERLEEEEADLLLRVRGQHPREDENGDRDEA